MERRTEICGPRQVNFDPYGSIRKAAVTSSAGMSAVEKEKRCNTTLKSSKVHSRFHWPTQQLGVSLLQGTPCFCWCKRETNENTGAILGARILKGYTEFLDKVNKNATSLDQLTIDLDEMVVGLALITRPLGLT